MCRDKNSSKPSTNSPNSGHIPKPTIQTPSHLTHSDGSGHGGGGRPVRKPKR